MSKRTRFERLFRSLRRHPYAVMGGLITVGALAFIGLMAVPHEGGLVSMLPERSRARRTVKFLRDANFADKVAVSITQGKGDAKPSLTTVMDDLARRFESSPHIQRVHTFPGGDQMMEEMTFFLAHAPELLTREDLDEIDGSLSQEDITRSIRQSYTQLARPEGSYMQDILRYDPLGVSRVLLKRLQVASESLGYQVTIEDGHLLHPDGEYGLLLMDSSVPLTDGVESARLLEMLDETTSDLPDGYSSTIVCGHQHTVSNERLLRRDIRLTVIVAAAGFLLLFLLVFHDIRAGIIFLIPAISILVAINVAALFIGGMSYMVLGFVPVMAGIAVDYGIHSYVATRQAEDPYPAVRGIIRPLVMGALTTQCVFVAFLFSSIPAYRELGGLAIAGITLALGGAILILPAVIQEKGENLPVPSASKRRESRWPAFIFLLSLAGAVMFIPHVEVDAGVENLNGVTRDVLQTEREFQELWGGGRDAQAIAVVGGDTFEEAARREDMLHQKINEELPEMSYLSRSSIWPSRERRQANLRRWRSFWTDERIRITRQRIQSAGEQFGFKENAFKRFFELMGDDELGPSRPEESAILEQLERRFVKERDDGYWFLGFFPDSDRTVREVGRVMDDIPDAFVVSRAGLATTLAGAIRTQGTRIALISVVLILIVTFMLMGNIRMAMAALLPALVGIMWLVMAMVLIGHPLNLANMIAGIVVIGLCIDYGIFMVHAWSGSDEELGRTRHAITLSALTTLMGAGVLVFALHPALFSIGVTLVVGVFSGFLAAIAGVPSLCVLLAVRRRSENL